MPAPHHSVFYRPDALPAGGTEAFKSAQANMQYWEKQIVQHLKTCTITISIHI